MVAPERHGERRVLARDTEVAFGDALGEGQGADRRAGDEAELRGGPDAGEEAAHRESVRADQDGVDDEEDDGQADVDGGGEHAQRADGVPAVGGDGVGDQRGGADRCEADDPPQHLLHDREQRRVELQERLGLGADLECGDADRGRDDEQLQHVEAQRRAGGALGEGGLRVQAQEVARHEARDERPPRAGGRRFLAGRR